MELFNAIYGRLSVGKTKPDALPQELIVELLDAAAQAPNHHRNRPWRFVVLSGAGREGLGAVMARSLRERNPEATPEALEAESRRPLRAPVIIAVGIDKAEDGKSHPVENICAGAAAVQNLLLAAHARGLAAVWRTGAAADDPAVKAYLGFEADQPLIALVYLGYPLLEQSAAPRPSAEDRTRWMD